MFKIPILPSKVQRANSPHVDDSSLDPVKKTKKKHTHTKKLNSSINMQSAIFLWVFLKPYQTHFYMFLLSHRSQYERKSFASSVFLHLSRMMRRGDLKKLYNYNTPKETHWDETQLQFKSVSRWATGPGFTCRRPLSPHYLPHQRPSKQA